MLEDATGALARLDATGLEELSERAEALRIALGAGMMIAGAPELLARFRVFASVVQATGKDLAMLERADAGKGASAPEMFGAGVRWVL